MMGTVGQRVREFYDQDTSKAEEIELGGYKSTYLSCLDARLLANCENYSRHAQTFFILCYREASKVAAGVGN